MGKRTAQVYETTKDARTRIKSELNTAIFTLFVSNYCCDELDGDTTNYILRRFWKDGAILVTESPVANIAKVYLGDDADMAKFLVFTQFTEVEWGYMDLPTKVVPLNPRGVPFIKDSRYYTPNDDCVIAHITKNRITPFEYVSQKIEDITNILMTMRTNLNALKMPYLVKVTPNKKNSADMLLNSMLTDEPLLFVDANNNMPFNPTNLGVQSHIKELYEQALCYMNEIYTFLGFDNSGQTFKAEHLNSDEVNSNNVIVNVYANNFKTALKEMEDDIQRVFGVRIHWYSIAEKSSSIHNDINNNDNKDNTKEIQDE